jgi:endonuclease YncB( thermonuclease family)
MALTKTAEVTFRLNGINAPEVEGSQKPRGLASKAALEGMLVGKALRVLSHKPDKYGRWLADVFVQGETASVSQRMIDGGFALAWDGTGPKPV